MKPLRTAIFLCTALSSKGCMAPSPPADPSPKGNGYMVERTAAAVNAMRIKDPDTSRMEVVPRSNVAAADLPELLAGNVLVGYWFSSGFQQGKRALSLSVKIWTDDGHFHQYSRKTPWPGAYGTGDLTVAVKSDSHGRVWPSLEMDYGFGPVSKSLLYDGPTGDAVRFSYIAPREEWMFLPGHLQRRLPAAVRRLCPDFPSAESLGLEVNTAQTAVFYDDLVAQHPGERILRPDPVTPHGDIAAAHRSVEGS